MLFSTEHEAALTRESPLSQHVIPAAQVGPTTVKTRGGEYVRVMRLAGAPQRTAPDDLVNGWHEARHHALASIANPDVALWTHIIRRRATATDVPGESGIPFADSLSADYAAALGTTALFVNELYLSIVVRPATSRVGGLFGRLMDRVDEQERRDQRQRALNRLDEVTAELSKNLGDYSPQVLATYEHEGRVCSEPIEFMARLVNGHWQRMPLVRSDLRRSIPTARPFWGKNLVQLQGLDGERFAGVIGVKEYAHATSPATLARVLDAPYECTLTQSFAFIARSKALDSLTLQRRRMVSAGDAAESQIDAIGDAMDHVQSGRMALGYHHLSMICFGDTIADTEANLTDAKHRLGEGRFIPAREQLAMEAAWWAQQPAAWNYRPRASLITSRNFAGLFSADNEPLGLPHSTWGRPITTLRTTSGTPFRFNWHITSESDAPGNTAIIGPTGSGKTVLNGFLLAQSLDKRPRLMQWDKDRGMEIVIRALAGTYFIIEQGKPTGFNPLQLPFTDANRTFLRTWLDALIAADGRGSLPPAQQEQLDAALRHVGELPAAERRLSTLLQFLDSTERDGPAARLKPWCADGAQGWLFDNPVDGFELDNDLIGIDITQILDMPALRTPTLLYLYHRSEEMIDGQRPFYLAMEEGWKVLDDPYFSARAKDDLKTIRKRNGITIFSTQSPADAIQSSICDTLVEQSVTKIYLPNPYAKWDQYKYLGINEREFEIISSLSQKSRKFLVKQADESVVCELDLGSMPDHIAVLSSTERNVGVMHEAIAEVGDDPSNWVPRFLERRA